MGRFLNADAFTSTGQGLLGNNMFAYCNNNPVNYSDPSGTIFVIDDIALYGLAALFVVVLIPILMPPPEVLQQTPTFDIFSKAAEDISVLLQAKKKPESLPKEGAPNSDEELLNEDGSVKQRRHFDEKGDAEYDVDFNHSDDGTHEFPHIHKWINGKRQKEWIPFSDYFN